MAIKNGETIAALLDEWSGKNLEREHKFLKLMKILGIGELKNSFESIYDYTLVEFGLDVNPPGLTLLFAEKKVKDAYQTNFEKALTQHLKSHKKLKTLRHIYKDANDLQPEIQRFKAIFDRFTMKSANPQLLETYNKMNRLMMKTLEENNEKNLDTRTGFSYQPTETQFLDFPLDEQSFKKIRERNLLYVDKTGIIARLIQRRATYFFLSRPRRFGKSLLVSTLKEIFNGNRELFKGLEIYDQVEWETYPVIDIDFSSIGIDKNFSLSAALAQEIDDYTHYYHLPSKKGTHKTKFRALIENLKTKTNKPVVILIDEYDYFIVRYLTDDRQREENRECLKEFFSVLKSSSDFLRFVFITGVSRFSRVSIFSDLNNLIDLTFDPGYSAVAGYTEEELSTYFINYIYQFARQKNCSLDYLWTLIRKWYNGYSWDGVTRVYNPFSILKLLSNYRFDDYWYGSGTPTFLIDFIRKEKIKLYELDRIKVDRSKLENMEVSKLELIPIMFQTGYLTIFEKIEERVDQEKFLVGYPNKDVRTSFLNHLIEDFDRENPRLIDRIILALREKKIHQALEYMKSIFASIPYNNFDYEKEASYHSVMHVIFFLILDNISDEVQTNIGRIDQVIETDQTIYIFEFKMEDARAAMAQIHEKKYYEKYMSKEKEIILVGVSFSKETRNIKEWLVESPDPKEKKKIKNRD
jgi:hypothetical protein